MPKIEIYTSPLCGYCHLAKKLLKQKGIQDFEEINVLGNLFKRSQMKKRSGRTSVPQIFIDDQHIGGFDDLYALNKAGDLDEILTN